MDIFGVTSELDNFHGLFLQSKCFKLSAPVCVVLL